MNNLIVPSSTNNAYELVFEDKLDKDGELYVEAVFCGDDRCNYYLNKASIQDIIDHLQSVLDND